MHFYTMESKGFEPVLVPITMHKNYFLVASYVEIQYVNCNGTSN